MTTDLQLQIARHIIGTGLVHSMFHSCELIKDVENRTLHAAYKQGAEYIYVGIDDQKALYGYIRTNGDANSVPLKITSCRRSYDVDTPLRVVFYNDQEDRDHEWLTTKLASFTFLTGVTLQRVIVDKFRLQREESDVQDPNFDGRIFYVAFDIVVNTILLPSDCAVNNCPVHPNPICKL